jgi:protein required for attachment to host cells
MSKLHIDHGDWVVVCDGAKALILENAGDEKFPNLRTRNVYQHADRPTHELGTDAPGRSHSSNGTARSAMEQTDFHDLAERHFLVELAGKLDAALQAGETRAVTIVASPRALGMIRQAYTPRLRQALRGEIDKDLVKLPVYEIEKHLAG